MTAKKHFLFMLCFSTFIMAELFSCRQRMKGNIEQKEIVKDSASIDTVKVITLKGSDQYPEIYAFIKVLINDHQLDTSYGLFMEPEIACDLSHKDITFLETVRMKKKEKIKPPKIGQDTSHQLDSNLHINFTKLQLSTSSKIISFEPERFLTRQDIRYMLAGKPDPLQFRWDNSELGFDTSNHQNFYSLSIPLFSIDHKKAIIMIENLCPGLCGTGNTYIYKRENNMWKTETSSFGWIH
jgi:hypothetical protein